MDDELLKSVSDLCERLNSDANERLKNKYSELYRNITHYGEYGYFKAIDEFKANQTEETKEKVIKAALNLSKTEDEFIKFLKGNDAKLVVVDTDDNGRNIYGVVTPYEIHDYRKCEKVEYKKEDIVTALEELGIVEIQSLLGNKKSDDPIGDAFDALGSGYTEKKELTELEQKDYDLWLECSNSLETVMDLIVPNFEMLVESLDLRYRKEPLTEEEKQEVFDCAVDVSFWTTDFIEELKYYKVKLVKDEDYNESLYGEKDYYDFITPYNEEEYKTCEEIEFKSGICDEELIGILVKAGFEKEQVEKELEEKVKDNFYSMLEKAKKVMADEERSHKMVDKATKIVERLEIYVKQTYEN